MENQIDSKKISTNRLFPIFLKLEKLSVLIVGGGNVGLEKLNAVLQNSPAASIKLVATTISEPVRQVAGLHQTIELIERAFLDDDVDDVDIVIVAVNTIEASKYISSVAKAKGKLVNVADKPELCDFYLSSVVKKGDLKIAISTNGKSPTMAKRIKEVLHTALPDELDEVINNLNGIRNQLNGDFAYKVQRLNSITQTLVDKGEGRTNASTKKIATYSLFAFALMLIGHFIFSYLPWGEVGHQIVNLYQQVGADFLWMVGAGFLAQLVDGALGMGYGVTSATVLLSVGINPAAISGSIHTAEMFASGASGYSHYKFGNVNKKLFKLLVIPGVLGAVLGAVLLIKLGSSNISYLRPAMACYTLFLGVRIFINAFRTQRVQKKFKHYRWLAGIGGFLDSFGGGGWGPIVTTTLITKGRSPKYVIGSVSLTEFFVTLASAFTFFTLLGVSHWQVILALVLGGLMAAPIAAKLTGKLPRKSSFILLGILVIIWSLKLIVQMF